MSDANPYTKQNYLDAHALTVAYERQDREAYNRIFGTCDVTGVLRVLLRRYQGHMKQLLAHDCEWMRDREVATDYLTMLDDEAGKIVALPDDWALDLDAPTTPGNL